MDIGWTSAIVSVTSAPVALGALVASVLDGRAGRRNAEFSVHRDLWWQRWSRVADGRPRTTKESARLPV
ncbi:hypothetical protein [Curtobacterium sp. MCPF17_051]|uniref:hypothetical protein n=1 Tax=Curtobacterium sp. MCPF17_051 TaxID=2175640 RepID=UPI000DA9A496|nr:hypothetical protein [Curtobacterium sp. MCPF17_051]PZF30793.1 hypothetical protein DEJ35_07475 [Curtobacterium sp. MCPF17_051]